MKYPQNLSEINHLHCPECNCTMLDEVYHPADDYTSYYCYKCEYEWDMVAEEYELITLFYAIS